MPPADAIAAMPTLVEHPLRRALADEMHARPFELLRPPLRISHLAVTAGEDGRAHLEALCLRHGLAAPEPGAIHFSVELAGLRLRWERHTEFSSFTLYRFGAFEAPFDGTALDLLPEDWLAGLPGRVVVAAHLALDGVRRSAEDLSAAFAGHSLIGATLAGGAAEAFTDLHLHGDGFSRVLIYDQGLTPGQAGRLTQRLLEIETYRVLTLLALPLARDASARLAGVGPDLAAIMAGLAEPDEGATADRELLARLTALAAQVEQLAAANSFRFSAAKAYGALVWKRVEELRESRIAGMQTFSEALGRRFAPAINTIEHAADRTEALAQHVARAGDLLRTRVDIALEEKNRDLLKSMNRRAALQLRLQETVEGLSVVAISYYLLGLLGYTAKGLKAAGLHLDSDLTVLVGLPVVAGMVALGVRRLRKAIGGDEGH
jgi:uncharacterized membrane-anchored protein